MLSALPHVRVHDSGNSLVPIIPILTGSIGRTLFTAKFLLENGVYVNPVLPPAVTLENCLLRTSYTATHTDAPLEDAVRNIGQVVAGQAANTEVDFDITL